MQSAAKTGNHPMRAALAAALASVSFLSGCGMPGAPMPPSLDLPTRVNNLAAVRAGNEVRLNWAMPTKNTDKLLMKDAVRVRICRNQANAAACSAIATIELPPGANGTYTDLLPQPLSSGAPRPLTYFVELDNRRGRSAGLSNPASILAGAAPAAVTGLSAGMRRDGVLLRWTPAPADTPASSIRLLRTLLSPPEKKSSSSPLPESAEPVERNLLVDSGDGRALDGNIRFGASYEYRAQRIARVDLNGKTLELPGPISAPVRILAVNVLPPAVPKDMAAIATAGENGTGPAIDLSWQPNTESDLAGYIVYRREGSTPWQRISSAQPVIGPGYHDANVLPGRTYVYAVSAIDQQGHESARSAETEENTPAQ